MFLVVLQYQAAAACVSLSRQMKLQKISLFVLIRGVNTFVFPRCPRLCARNQEHCTYHRGGTTSSRVVDPTVVFEPRGVTPQDTAVFAIGVIPFAWATWEFWRRIVGGESFGTGSDSVIIGEDLNPESSRGRRVLGNDALAVAYVLFGVAGCSILLALVSGVDVLSH